MQRLFLLTAASVLLSYAQAPDFHSQTREVVVPVSVTTHSGAPVEGLEQKDFTLLDDGKPQPVRLIERDTAAPLPIDAVLVVQTDEGSAPVLAKLRKTASVISSYLIGEEDSPHPNQLAVVFASDDVKLIQPFSPDPNLLRDTLNGLNTDGDSNRLIDAVDRACDLLGKRPQPSRRVIVLIGSSRDHGSRNHFGDVLVKAQKLDVVIYTLSYLESTTAFTQKGSERVTSRKDIPSVYDSADSGGMNLLAVPALLIDLARTNIAEAFARSTGGSHQSFTTLRTAVADLQRVGSEVHNRYTLTFVPPASDKPGYHELTVSVTGPSGIKVRSRTGYWLSATD